MKKAMITWSVLNIIVYYNLSTSDKNYLNIAIKGLTSIDEIEIYNKDNLTGLDLSYNKITNIELLKKFLKLEYLDLSQNERIHNIDSLKYLDLSFNKIASIRSLQNLSNLTKLKVTNNRINNIDIKFNMPNIECFDLTKNNIDKISDSSIDNCFNLRILFSI